MKSVTWRTSPGNAPTFRAEWAAMGHPGGRAGGASPHWFGVGGAHVGLSWFAPCLPLGTQHMAPGRGRPCCRRRVRGSVHLCLAGPQGRGSTFCGPRPRVCGVWPGLGVTAELRRHGQRGGSGGRHAWGLYTWSLNFRHLTWCGLSPSLPSGSGCCGSQNEERAKDPKICLCAIPHNSVSGWK